MSEPPFNLQEHLAACFPMREKYTDCTGTEVSFVISVRSLPVGFIVEANEISDSGLVYDYGYEFSQAAEVDPFKALGILRRKIRKALSRRFLVEEDGKVQMAADELDGVISDRGLVIDGDLVPWDEIQRMLTTCEGFPIKIVIGDRFL